MTNHVHLLITPEREESAGLLMKHLGQRYQPQGRGVPPPPLEHFQCSFGHWLTHDGKDRYGNVPAFQEITRLHTQVHTLAGKLIAYQTQGNYPAAASTFEELHKLKDRLLVALQSLHRRDQKLQVV